MSKTWKTLPRAKVTRYLALLRGINVGFGKEPTKYRYNVILIKAPLTVAEAIKNTPLKEGVDQVFAGPEALYHIRLESKAA